MDQGHQILKIWCGSMRSILSLKSQGMCWERRMHLGTLEVSLKDFDEELLCLGFSRVHVRGLADDSVTRLDKMRIWFWR